MADVVITVSDPDAGTCTVFESLQLEEPQDITSSKRRPSHQRRSGSESPPVTTLLPTATFRFSDDDSKLKPCSYYRHMFLCNDHRTPHDLSYWANYREIKKSAGQKVVQKMASQQQRLAAEAAGSKKEAFRVAASEGKVEKQKGKFPTYLKRKPHKLEPLNIAS